LKLVQGAIQKNIDKLASTSSKPEAVAAVDGKSKAVYPDLGG